MTTELKDLTRLYEQNKALAQLGDRLLRIANNRGPALSRKAAVPGIGTVDLPAFVGDPDAQPLVDSVRRRSAPGRVLELGGVGVPPRQLLPAPISDPEPAWVTEGGPVPLARLSTASTFVDSKYYAFLLAFIREVLRLTDARARNLLLSRSTRALIRADDSAFLSTATASASQPAGILAGRSAIGSGSPANLDDDLQALVAYVNDGDLLSPLFFVSARGAAFLNGSGINAFRDLGLKGGTIAGAPALVTPAAGERLILVDATEIAIADDGVDIGQSEHAAIEMLDNPTVNSATPTATSLVSAFQAGAVVLRYVRYLSWTLLRDDAVGFLEMPIGGSPA
jgi:hypothetical protein